MAPTDDSLLHFYRVEAMQDPLDAFKIYYVKVFSAGMSCWCLHPHFLLEVFLAYEAPCHGNSGVFSIPKLYFTNT